MVSIEIKNMIVEHLALNNKLHIAAKEILENGRLSVMDVATKYGLEFGIINRKINIMKRKEKFNERKPKFDAARKEIMEGKSTNSAVAKSYEINANILRYEVMKARTQENYEYDIKISTGSTFTYLQEESLLNILKDRARSESSQDRCSCTFCALEKLLTLAYEFAQLNNIECRLWNTFRRASIKWLINFEMRHSDEITNSFDPFVNHFEQNIA